MKNLNFIFLELLVKTNGQHKSMILKYQLPNFYEYVFKNKFPDERSKHTAEVVKRYYDLAYYQMLDLQRVCGEFFNIENPTNNQINEYLNRCWSHAYAMYSLLRTSTEALSIFRKMIGDRKLIDSGYQNELIRIINIANNVVKHPMYKHGQLSEGAQAVSIDISCGIDVALQSDITGQITKMELNPMGDFYVTRNHIEYIFKSLI